MKTNSADMLKAMPDFEEFMAITTDIANLLNQKLTIEAEIKYAESEVFRLASTQSQYFQNGKPPAISYIENTYKYPGLSNEIIPMRNKLVPVVAELEKKRLQLDIYKSMIDVWRTLSSSERSTSI